MLCINLAITSCIWSTISPTILCTLKPFLTAYFRLFVPQIFQMLHIITIFSLYKLEKDSGTHCYFFKKTSRHFFLLLYFMVVLLFIHPIKANGNEEPFWKHLLNLISGSTSYNGNSQDDILIVILVYWNLDDDMSQAIINTIV